MQRLQGYQEGIISWSIKSSQGKENKGKANVSFLCSSEQDEEKVQSGGIKAFLEKDAHSK